MALGILFRKFSQYQISDDSVEFILEFKAWIARLHKVFNQFSSLLLHFLDLVALGILIFHVFILVDRTDFPDVFTSP